MYGIIQLQAKIKRTSTIARNSAFSNIQMAAAEKKDRIRNNAACTGLLAEITRSAAKISTAEKI